jgi:hypothetical protein
MCLFLWEGIAFTGFGYVALTERGPGVTNTDRLWTTLGISIGICLLLDSLMALLFLAVGSRRAWYGALMMSLIGFVGSLRLSWVGYQLVVEAVRRGGDWKGLHVATAWLFGVLGPLTLATFPLEWFIACLLILRPGAMGKGKVPDVDGDLS